MDSGKSIGVLGAGPVGSILAAGLAKLGRKVVLIECSDKRREQIAEHGLCIEGKESLSTRDVDLVDSLEQLEQRKLAAFFICTKAWSLRTILPTLAQKLDPEAVVVSFQNGIGTEDEISRHFPARRVARGVVNYAGGVDDDERGAAKMIWFNPPNFLGPMDEAAAPLMETLAQGLTGIGLETRAISLEEIKKLVFFKTILNAGLSALCSVGGVTMLQAMTYRHTRNQARTLLREGLSVAAALGYHYGENALQSCMGYLDKGGDHMPSMWVDLQRGTPTEIEYINGKIVEIGSMFNALDLSANLFMTAAIVTQEIKAGSRDADDLPEYLRQF
jgi:2-dehydropantoate 2-reductase